VVTFTASTSSGSPVGFTENGPCTLTGNTFTVTQGNGQCRVTASSPGGNGLAPTSGTVTVNMVLGTQRPARPLPTSDVRVNQNLVLAPANQNRTNAGVRMNWRITSGANRCQLRFPSNGSVQLRGLRAGTCNVRVTAPAVAGQWRSMTINRTYRVR
jgi:hypothetical protein